MLPSTRQAKLDEIPIVDLRNFSFANEAEELSVADELAHACKTAGFAYIVNHGIEPSSIDRIFDVAKGFFDLPEGDKEEVSLKKSGLAFNGFLPTAHLGADKNLKSDLHESFQAHLDLPADDPDVLAGTAFYGPNLWPSALPSFKSDAISYQLQVRGLGDRMLRLLALGLRLAPDTFVKMTTKPTSMLRMLHYPPQSPTDTSESLGTRAHTDTGVITILAQDDVGGLEVLLNSGEWVSAPPYKGSYVINIGDMMKTWTDGIYASTPHRVINRSGRERYSVPFFVNPNYKTPFEPILTNPNPGQAKFESLIKNPDKLCYGDWLVEVYSRIYNKPAAAA